MTYHCLSSVPINGYFAVCSLLPLLIAHPHRVLQLVLLDVTDEGDYPFGLWLWLYFIYGVFGDDGLGVAEFL